MGNDFTPVTIAELLRQHQNSSDSEKLARAIWQELYRQLPQLTVSKHKADQHRILEDRLVALGLPQGADLQYVAGPMLWYAREHGVLPPAQDNGSGKEPWALDQEKYEALSSQLNEGFIFYGAWMTSALSDLLHPPH